MSQSAPTIRLLFGAVSDGVSREMICAVFGRRSPGRRASRSGRRDLADFTWARTARLRKAVTLSYGTAMNDSECDETT